MKISLCFTHQRYIQKLSWQFQAGFIIDACTLFDVFWTVKQKHLPTAMIELRSARTILYNSDWICLKEESQIHIGCLEGE